MQFLPIITCLLQLSADGWTVLAPSPDSRTIYVSSSEGSDTNSGLTESQPLKTIAKAFSLAREDCPDHVLLRRGDTFTEGRQSWYKGGRSPAEPMVMASYGDGPRPVLQNTGFLYWGPNGGPLFSLDNLSFVGLEFRADWDNNEASISHANAILFGGGVSSILFEDCAFYGHKEAVQIQSVPEGRPLTGVTIRRCVFADAAAQGILTNYVDGIVIEDCVFDRIGWKDGVANIFRHGIYIKHCRGLTVRNNIFARCSNFGSKLSADSPDGFTDFRVENNLYIDNGIGIDHSSGPTGNIRETFTHRNGEIINNVFTELGQTFSDGNKQDLAAWLLNSTDVTWSGNIFTQKPVHAGNPLLAWNGHHGTITVQDTIVHRWNLGPAPNRVTPRDYLESNAGVIDNYAIIGNELDLPDTAYVDPNRTVDSYWQSIGGQNGVDGFVTAARKQGRNSWSESLTASAVNAYIRAGFEKAPVEPMPQPGLEQIQRIRAELDALEAILKATEVQQ